MADELIKPHGSDTLNPLYVADDAKRAEVAKTWSDQFGHEFKPQDINCDGCTSGSERLFSHCSACEIRACAQGKGLANCAHCDDYACDKLEAFFKMVPDARKNLDAIRSGL